MKGHIPIFYYFLMCMKFNQSKNLGKTSLNLSNYGFYPCLIRKSLINSLNRLVHTRYACIYNCIHTYAFIINNIHNYIRLKYRSQRASICKVYNTRLRFRNMKDKERAPRNAHFQKELDSLKVSVARLTTLLD